MRDDKNKWHLRQHPWDCVLSGNDGVPKVKCVHLNKKNNPPSCGYFHRDIYVAELQKPDHKIKNPEKIWVCKSLKID